MGDKTKKSIILFLLVMTAVIIGATIVMMVLQVINA
ncbi:hypothetical protein Bsel_1586 [[Bacillus] selenitireducens MLS10]|uniref:DUF4044 domain-containing protein n=1 Tax=Bacillus selenitireducens (strain ATCC 700615 / DSM 15326 / MLS10) TaxID=439292 RepID=D6XTG0_BACIE|nr:hypothetical protein Bsel_1586 [[Bacillus] selenitireducens MLS10]